MKGDALVIENKKVEVDNGSLLDTGERIFIMTYFHRPLYGLLVDLNEKVTRGFNGRKISDTVIKIYDEKEDDVIEKSMKLLRLIGRAGDMGEWRFFGKEHVPEIGQECIFIGGTIYHGIYMIKGHLIDDNWNVHISEIIRSDIDDLDSYLRSKEFKYSDDDWRKKFYIFAPYISDNGEDITSELMDKFNEFKLYIR